MLIGVQKRFVFIANSKTASTSIESALTPYAEINRVGSPQRKHISWQEARSEYSFLFDQPQFSPNTFFKFGVLREPSDWVRSWFNYRLGNSKIESPLPSSMTFEEFWRGDDWVKSINQKSKFLDNKGEMSFDAILPQDELAQLFPIVSSLLGINVTLQKENRSPSKFPKELIPEELLNELNNFYIEDYEFYLDWKSRCKGVLEGMVLAGRGQYQLSTSRTDDDKSLILHAAIDVLPTKSILPQQPESIGGVVVLTKDAPEGCVLRITNADDKGSAKEVSWGIHSQMMAEQYPEAKNGSISRFRINGIKMELGATYKLCLFKDSMELSKLFDITLMKKDTP
jgi:hypothetical protein